MKKENHINLIIYTNIRHILLRANSFKLFINLIFCTCKKCPNEKYTMSISQELNSGI